MKCRTSSVKSPEVLHSSFLSILPRIELHARIFFRHVKCPNKKDDCIAEVAAIAWKWFQRLAEKGKDATQFVSALATLAARAVSSGRRLCGQSKAKDVLNELTQQRHSFTVSSLPNGSSLTGNVFDEALADNTVSPVPEQVAFRLDFPAWRLTRYERDRRLIDELMVGERTLDVAKRHGLSPARISQLRRDFHDDWLAFCDARPETEVSA